MKNAEWGWRSIFSWVVALGAIVIGGIHESEVRYFFFSAVSYFYDYFSCCFLSFSPTSPHFYSYFPAISFTQKLFSQRYIRFISMLWSSSFERKKKRIDPPESRFVPDLGRWKMNFVGPCFCQIAWGSDERVFFSRNEKKGDSLGNWENEG